MGKLQGNVVCFVCDLQDYLVALWKETKLTMENGVFFSIPSARQPTVLPHIQRARQLQGCVPACLSHQLHRHPLLSTPQLSPS